MIPWNFAKFFVDASGKVVKYFPPEETMETVMEYIDDRMGSAEEDL